MHSIQEDQADQHRNVIHPIGFRATRKLTIHASPQRCGTQSLMRTAQGDQTIASGCTVETATQKGLIGQIGGATSPDRNYDQSR